MRLKPGIMHFAEIGLKVKDLHNMVDFYQDILGLNIELQEENYVFLKVGKLESPLGVVGHPQMLVLFDRGIDLDIAVSTLDHLAFEIPSAEYDSQRQRLEEKGLKVLHERSYPDTLMWKAKSFFFHDPEGNVIELIAHDPKS